MPRGRSSDVVATDPSGPPFVRRDGCFVSRGASWLVALLFVGGVVATGLVVYFYAPGLQGESEVDGSLRRVGKALRLRQPEASTPSATTAEDPSATAATAVEEPSTTATITTEETATTTPTAAASTATTATAEAPEKEKIELRLPRALKPLHYVVKLQPFINGNFSILGHVEVEVEVLESTHNVTLHMADIITKNDTVKVRDMSDLKGHDLPITRHEFDGKRQFYVAHLQEALKKGHRYLLTMDFEGFINKNLNGFYRSSYIDSNGITRMLAVTQFQATDARRAFPCFDEPGLKATFEVFLARERNMTSISNMPIVQSLPVAGQDGWFWDQYNTTVIMPTYLLAFVVSDLVYINSTGGSDTLFRVWSRKSAIEQGRYSLQIGPQMTTYLEDYFNHSYSLPKQDMIAIPDFSALAMENWGLITYREKALLYDPGVSSVQDKYEVAGIVAHELAHQWFGNLVSPKWWNDLWLSEGFASYLEDPIVDAIEPTWKSNELFIVNILHSVFSTDSLETSRHMRKEVETRREIDQMFDRITYHKGASIIRMMNHFLTESTFRKGLSNYLDAFKYDNAEQDDLWRHLTEAAHQDGNLPRDLTVKTIMDTWTLQMGYPVIHVVRSPNGTSATVSQERFLLVQDANSEDTHEYRWWVPLTYTTEEEPNFNDTRARLWLKETQKETTLPSLLPGKDKWVLFNLQQTGYYRVNYDHHNWKMIMGQLLTDHKVISTVNRAQIMNDAMNLARSGHLNYELALGLFRYLSAEVEYVPWASAIKTLGFLRAMLHSTAIFGALKKYIVDIIIPQYEHVGFENRLDDPFLEQLQRKQMVKWACVLGHKDCLNNALSLYRQWMKNPDNSTIISPILRSQVYCRALGAGGEEEWDFAWEQYIKSNVASERNLLLSSMGCAKENWILARYMDMAFDKDSGIRKQDAVRAFTSTAWNNDGRPQAWNYLREQWEKIHDYFDGNVRSRIFDAVTNGFNTKQRLNELLEFQKERKSDLKSVSWKIAQRIEKIKTNIRWMDKYYEVIRQWLEQQGFTSRLRSSWIEYL